MSPAPRIVAASIALAFLVTLGVTAGSGRDQPDTSPQRDASATAETRRLLAESTASSAAAWAAASGRPAWVSSTSRPTAYRTQATGRTNSTRIDAITKSSIFLPESGITVANLTVQPGTYIVSFSFESRIDSPYPADSFTCGVRDSNSSSGSLFFADSSDAQSGRGWERHSGAQTFSLPDLTLSLRCLPSRVGLSSASFRDVVLTVTELRG